MIRSTSNIKLTSEFKEKALNLINDTIEETLNKSQVSLEKKEKTKIKNLSLDQINIDVAHRNKLKAMWVFDTEEFIPIMLFVDKRLTEAYLKDNPDDKVYYMEPNGDWKMIKDDKDGVDKKEFEETVLQMLLEDFETAAFYGTLSYMSGGIYG